MPAPAARIRKIGKRLRRTMDMDAADIANLPALWRHLSNLLRLLWRMTRRFVEDRCIQRASALAFATLLAIVPLLVLCFSVFSSFPVFESTASRVLDWGLQFLMPTTQDTLKRYLDSVTGKSAALSAFGVVGLLITVTALLNTVEEAFNDIWRIRQARPLLARFFIFWSLLTLSPMLIAISTSITSYFAALPALQGMAAGASSIRQVPFLLPWLISSAGMTALYKLLPNTHVPLSRAIVGGMVAGALFELSKYGFTLYVRGMTTNYENIYGVLATLPLLLLWIYLVWFVVLIGAELVFCLQHPERSQRHGAWMLRPGIRHFHHYLILLRAAQALQRGRILCLADLAKETRVSTSDLQQRCEELAAQGLLRRLREPDDGWTLARDPASLTLEDIHRRMIPQGVEIPDTHDEHPLGRILRQTHDRLHEERKSMLDGISLRDVLLEESAFHGAPNEPSSR